MKSSKRWPTAQAHRPRVPRAAKLPGKNVFDLSPRGSIGRRAIRTCRQREAPAHVGRSSSSSGVDVAHAETDASLAIDFQHFHTDDIAFLELIADALHTLVGDLRNVDQAVLAREYRHERAKVHEPHDAAFVDTTHLDVGRDELDAPLRLASGHTVDRRNLDRAVVLDVDARARLFRDRADDGTALADDVADLLRVDLDRDDRRRPFGHVRARLGEDLVHLIQDVQTRLARLLERDLHDLPGDAVDLDVHLQRGDTGARARDLEVHITQMVLVTKDVREHLEAITLFDQPHRNPGNGSLDRHPGIHQR